MSTQINKVYPSEVLIGFGANGSKAMADQLTTVSELRFLDKAGSVSSTEMIEIERIIKDQLDLK